MEPGSKGATGEGSQLGHTRSESSVTVAWPPSTEIDPTVEFAEQPELGGLGRSLLLRAMALRATDIHLEPQHDGVRVRLRIDGQLETLTRLSPEAGHALLNQWKIAAKMDIADPFHAQEGRIDYPTLVTGYDARLTTALVHGGETAAVRLLNRMQLVRPLEELGFSPRCLGHVQSLIEHGEGVVLITGPTGVGKTTTLYSIIHALDNGRRNIVSIEDPVEFDLPTIQQMEVDLRHQVTFAQGLKTLLRLDPDVIMIGEIRDPETAAVAMRSASSGKYVFTTFHTRDIASTVTGLRDLQVDSRSLAGNLRGIISQRLVRRLCPACRDARELTQPEHDLFAAHAMTPPLQVNIPVGCPNCRQTGYAGRIGVFEVETNNHELERAIAKGDPEDNIRELLRRQGSPTLAHDALTKVQAGITSVEEALHMSWVRV